jgi:hypothetical protein
MEANNGSHKNLRRYPMTSITAAFLFILLVSAAVIVTVVATIAVVRYVKGIV